jgi:superfamily II DNA or RNA helicase
MKNIKEWVGKNFIMQCVDDSISAQASPSNVLSSWRDKIKFIEENSTSGQEGLRVPQIGALFALLAHWTTSTEPATIVMPTGTGKTETMISTIIARCCEKVLVIVPSDLLRNQVVNKCLTCGLLKDIGVIDKSAINPVVTLLKHTPESIEDLNKIIAKSNIVVSTISLINRLPDGSKTRISEAFSHLFIDEAHHVEAKTWKTFKSKFNNALIVQFTATPFRNDGKKVDGKIIYNYPLMKAQEEDYFRPINFIPIFEFDDQQSDFSIAKKAIEQLECDLNKGYNHVILVRSDRKKRAERLYNEIYKPLYNNYNPVLVYSGLTKTEKDKAINDVKNGLSKILVCVDMFGEGIDIPQLKIAAIHDRYKSLAITIQFIGRFARSRTGLGEASVIANIADDNISGAIKELYSEDADWNKLLRNISSDAIGKEISLQELAQGFSGSAMKEIKIEQLVPKMSMIAFTTSADSWDIEGWRNTFDEDKCIYKVNEDKKVAVIIEKVENKIEWSRLKDISYASWELHLVYWNKNTQVLFVNSTNKSVHRKLAGNIFADAQIISGEQAFRCLNGIKRLMLSTVGLNSKIDGPIRYKMFAGIDVATGISEAQKANNEKSNLFGVGFDGQGPVSIGCSYKGRIWSRWVESLDYWCNWCDGIAEKLLNDNIEVKDILKGVLVPEIVTTRPNVIPCSVEWPIDFQLNTEEKATIILPFGEYSAREVDISLGTFDETSPLRLIISNENFSATFELRFDTRSYSANYVCIDQPAIEVKIGRHQERMVDYFKENGPLFRFVDQSVLETNYYTRLENNEFIRIDDDNIAVWDWSDVDIKKESQGKNKAIDSIQYRTISNLKNNDYDIIFDDDNSGEIADIITIKNRFDKIEFEFYHCKFSSSHQPGSRVDDLYVVCGQAQKSIIWKQNGVALIERMLSRERTRMASSGISRFEKGDIRKLIEIKNKLKKFPFDLRIYVVQPGVDSKAITDQMHQVLGSTKTYLLDTYGLRFQLICS